MNLTNYHSHCDYCDGRAPLEFFIREAVTHGFTAYGISSHAPLAFHTRWTMDMEDTDAYLAEAFALKEKYAGIIEIYVGMEIDYYNDESNPASDFFKGLSLDYSIGSIHFVKELMETDGDSKNFKENLGKFYDGDLNHLVDDYFEASMRMVELGGFDILGHCDKLALNAEFCSQGYSSAERFRGKVRDLLTFAAERDVLVEINTKKYATDGLFFPDVNYFPLLKDLKIRLVVNSDAHYPDKINSGRPEAFSALKSAGIKSVWELHNNMWAETRIL